MKAAVSLVLHSCTSRSFSGLERYVLDLVSWQHAAGKPVELFCRAGTELERQARARGVPVWAIGENDKYGPRLWPKMVKNWSRRLKSGNVTLHMHAGGEAWYHLPWLLTRPQGLAKTILHYHIWINHKKKDPVHWLVFRGIDEVWTSSESSRAHLASLLPVPRERIRVVPYGRDVRSLTALSRKDVRPRERDALGLEDADVLGICVSRIEPIKGVGELFDAFLGVADRNPRAHLAIVGNVSPDNDEAERFWTVLEERYRKLPEPVRSRLHFLGYQSDCRPAMLAADFYVLPSYEECMSLALLDALILGLPAVGTNSGGTPSVARPQETGLLASPRDVGSLREALSQMYENAGLREKLSEGARSLGPSFDQEKIFGSIWGWYV